MKHTLLLRLAGPMQSWGDSSRFGIRETRTEPTKSGVVGLLCAALGWDRAEETFALSGRSLQLVDLTRLKFGVRVEQEGVLRRDYHTAQQVLKASARVRPGKAPSASDLQGTVLSERFYLSDAYFIAGLESEDAGLLQELSGALAKPHWPLCLGRKAFIPSRPVVWAGTPAAGVLALPLAQALLSVTDPLTKVPNTHRRKRRDRTLRIVLDATADDTPLQQAYQFISRSRYTDVPLSFQSRRFAPREVSTYIRPQPDVSIPTDSAPA